MAQQLQKAIKEQEFLRTLYETRKPVFPAEKVLNYIQKSIKNVESPDDVASSAYTINSDLSRSINSNSTLTVDDRTMSVNEGDNDGIDLNDVNNFEANDENVIAQSPREGKTALQELQLARSKSLGETVNLMAKKISLFDKIVESAKLENTELKKPEKLKLPFGAGSKQTFDILKKQIEKLKKELKKKLNNSSPQKDQEQVNNENYAKIVQVTFDNKTLIPQKVEIFDKEDYKNNNTENPKDLVSMKTFIAYQLQNNKKGLTTDGQTTMSFYYNGDETKASDLNFENPIL